MACLKPHRLFFLLIVLLLICHENEARRKILKGRKVITRTYYRDSILPAWAVVLLTGLGELVFGALLYIFLRVMIINPSLKPRYTRYLTAASRSATP